MSNRLKELRNKRGKLVADMRAILDKADTEKRDVTGDEQKQYDTMFEEQDKLRTNIEREERQAELDRQLAQRSSDQPDDTDPGNKDPEKRNLGPRATPEYRKAFANYLSRGRNNMSPEEIRAMQVDPSSQGGYLVAPEEFVANLIKRVNDLTFIRAMATKIPVTQAQSLGIPTLDADPADADWTAELATGSEDNTMAIGKRRMVPHAVAKRIKVSNDLLMMAAIGAEALVMERLAYKFAITEEKAFLTGSGVDQPLGVFTASNDGVPTSCDISAGNTTTAITFDGLIAAKYQLKAQYWPKASWLFHRTALKTIAQLKDNYGQYLWRQSVRVGEPDTILGAPLMMSEYVPNTFTTGLYVGMFADFSWYYIADAMDMSVRRLDELYAETNQVGFIGRKKTDGTAVLSEAFARVTLA